MNIAQHPELVDKLAANYALGTLRGAARRRFEHLARQHPHLRAAALTWEGRLSGLTEIQAPSPAPSAVWTRIDNLVQADVAHTRQSHARQAHARAASSTPAKTSWFQNLALWRGAAFASVAVAALVVVNLTQQRDELGAQLANLQTRSSTDVSLVAVLNDANAKPTLLATFNPAEQTLTLQRVGSYQEAADRNLQLWALPEGGAPQSLGVLAREGMVRLKVQGQDWQNVPALAVSLEPLGGAPAGSGPTGPVVFTGAMLRRSV